MGRDEDPRELTADRALIFEGRTPAECTGRASPPRALV